MTDKSQANKEKLADAYQRFVELTHETTENVAQKSGPVIERAMDKAKKTLHELGELSKDEGEFIKQAVTKDLHDAAQFVRDSGRSIADWLRLDLLYLEEAIVERISQLANQTAEELHHIEERATQLGQWHSGEMTGPGVLTCNKCGEALHFARPGHVPPCPKCHATVFHRAQR